MVGANLNQDRRARRNLTPILPCWEKTTYLHMVSIGRYVTFTEYGSIERERRTIQNPRLKMKRNMVIWLELGIGQGRGSLSFRLWKRIFRSSSCLLLRPVEIWIKVSGPESESLSLFFSLFLQRRIGLADPRIPSLRRDSTRLAAPCLRSQSKARGSLRLRYVVVTSRVAAPVSRRTVDPNEILIIASRPW